MKTWRTHVKTRPGRPSTEVPFGIRDQFLVECALASEGYARKMGYAQCLSCIESTVKPLKPRGLVHDDEKVLL